MLDEVQTGLRARALLDESADRLPQALQLKLNGAIQAALLVQKQTAAVGTHNPMPVKPTAGGLPPLNNLMDTLFGWMNRPAMSFALSALFVLGAGYGIVQETENFEDKRLDEYAEIDAAILTDELPTEAFLDPGFVNFSGEVLRQNFLQLEDTPAPDTLNDAVQETPST